MRALESLARHYVSDREVLRHVDAAVSETRSWSVQAAIAGILIRADRRSIASPELVRTLADKRLPAPAGAEDMIDELIRVLQLP